MFRLWLLLFLAVPLTAGAQSQLGVSPRPPAARPVPVIQAPKAARATRPVRRPARVAAPPASAVSAVPVEPAPAPVPAEPAKGSVTGLPLPRFVALRTDDVNLRAGPGTRYQIEWVYHRRDLPVQIEREFENWRLISDLDGVKGWVHLATLSGRRTFITKVDDLALRNAAAETAPAAAILKQGVVGRIVLCAAGADWCEVQTSDYRGYLKRESFWGTYPGEAVN